jgi:hypothetical protein
VEAGNYGGLSANAAAIFYQSRDAGQFGGGNLVALPITSDDPKPVIATNIHGVFELLDAARHFLKDQDAGRRERGCRICLLCVGSQVLQNPETFGKGEPEGVIASETAANACDSRGSALHALP